jgi:hypothetical protein
VIILPNAEMAKQVAEEQRQDLLREAETYRLLRQAGIGRPSWPSRQVCWLLSRLGHVLVILGRRLERYEGSPAASSGNHSAMAKHCPIEG